jgi:hypothetical protein
MRCGAIDISLQAEIMAALIESWPQPAHSVEFEPS